MGILLCGLNGVGKSTLGRILAERLSYQFIDNEDLYFPENDDDYPFANPRSKDEVIRLLDAKINADNHFVFAAVKGDYGEKLLAKTDCVVLIEVPKDVRLSRVKNRSIQRFGDRVLGNGDLAKKEDAWFLFVNSRPENYVTEWIEEIKCPIIRIDGTLPIEDNVEYLIPLLEMYLWL